MVTIVVLVLAGTLVLGLFVVIGNRMLREGGGAGGGAADGMGGFVDAFDPARARAERDLESKDNQGEVAPVPLDHDLPVAVDLTANRVTIRRPAG